MHTKADYISYVCKCTYTGMRFANNEKESITINVYACICNDWSFIF